MKGGGETLWNAENATRKTIWRIIQRANNTFRSNVWTSSDFTERSGKNPSIWQISITRNLSGLWADRGENLERRSFDSRPGRFGKAGCIRYFSLKNQRKGSFDQTKRWWILIPNSRWYSKIVRKRLRIPRTRGEIQGESEESQPAEPNRWRWSPCRLWWMCYKRRGLTIIGTLIQANICQVLVHVVWGETDKDPNNNHTRSCVARSSDEHWKSRSKSRKKQDWKNEKPKLDTARRLRGFLLYWSRRQRILRISQKRKKKIGKTYGSCDAV